MHTRLPQWKVLHTCIVWKSSRENGVKLEVLQDPSFDCVSAKWTGFKVDVGVSAHYFDNSIDITVHRIYMIPTVTGELLCYSLGRHRVSVS